MTEASAEMEMPQRGVFWKFGSGTPWWIHLCDELVGFQLTGFPPVGKSHHRLAHFINDGFRPGMEWVESNPISFGNIIEACVHSVIINLNLLKQ